MWRVVVKATLRARYVCCRGRLLADLVTGAERVIIRIVHEDGQDWFGGYVALDGAGDVLEKSDNYGAYEGEADDFDGWGDECTASTRREFSEAWSRPYARRSLRRRFMANLAGKSAAGGDPSERDAPSE